MANEDPSGVRDELVQLYEQTAEDVFAYFEYLAGDAGLAGELLAESFAELVRALGAADYEPGSEPDDEAQALRLELFTGAVALGRTQEVAARPGPAALEIAAGRAGADANDADRQALNALAFEERELLALRYGAQLTAAEVAEILGERTSTIERQTYEALVQLKSSARRAG